MTIYLDHNASTPVAPSVAALMQRYVTAAYGNPSSMHWAGYPARAAVSRAREQVAASLGAAPDEIVFTSGGSEANNMAIKGLWFAPDRICDEIIVSAVEHPAVIAPCRFLERLGARITMLPVDCHGRVTPADLARVIGPRTLLVSIMHANNEVGTVQPIRALADIARAHAVPFHTDAAQSLGKIDVDANALGVDLLTIAGHKLYAPKGIGALYIRRGVQLESLIHGAGHESGRRAGTESALLAAALGEACAIVDRNEQDRVRQLRDAMWRQLVDRFGKAVVLNGHPVKRLPNTLNVSFVGRIGADILAALDGVAASTGSACHAGEVTLSPTLAAMGVAPATGMGAIRFSLGRETTAEQVDAVVQQLGRVLG